MGSIVSLSSAHCLDQQLQQGAAESQKGPTITGLQDQQRAPGETGDQVTWIWCGAAAVLALGLAKFSKVWHNTGTYFDHTSWFLSFVLVSLLMAFPFTFRNTPVSMINCRVTLTLIVYMWVVFWLDLVNQEIFL